MSQATISRKALEAELSSEVEDFARERGAEQYVRLLLDMTRRLFANAVRLEILVEGDPEIANDPHIVFEIDVRGLDVPQAVAAQQTWVRELFALCPPTLACVFRLGLELVD